MLTYQCADCRVVQPPTEVHPERCASCGGHAYPTDGSLRVQAALIAEQNDRFRASFGMDPTVPGRIVSTASVADEGVDFMLVALASVASFDSFTEDNDPYGWHDFGSLNVAGVALYWKVDLFDQAYLYGSDDPADPARTRRVLTIYRPDEH